jgi:hypothetical protein
LLSLYAASVGAFYFTLDKTSAFIRAIWLAAAYYVLFPMVKNSIATGIFLLDDRDFLLLFLLLFLLFYYFIYMPFLLESLWDWLIV